MARAPADPIAPLEYAPQRRWVRRRWKRLVLLSFIAMLGAGAWIWHIELRQAASTARLLYAQHRCMTFDPPAGQVAYEEDPARLKELLSRSDYRSAKKADGTAGAALWWPKAARDWPEINHYAWLNPTPAVLFMHELTTPKGRKVLVLATASFEETVPDGVGVRVQAVEPATWRRGSASAHGMAAISVKPPRDRDHSASVADCPPVRFYAGRQDAKDPSQFNVEYRAGDYWGVMKGWVRDGPPESLPAVEMDLGFYPLEAVKTEPHPPLDSDPAGPDNSSVSPVLIEDRVR